MKLNKNQNTQPHSKKKNQKRMPHHGIEPAYQKRKSEKVKGQTHSATEPSISPSVITCTVQVNRTSWLRENNDEKFCKISKISLLETL